MSDNRVRLGPFALKILQKYAGEADDVNGRHLDDMLMNIFHEGGAFQPDDAAYFKKIISALPDWSEYEERLISRVYTGVDGIGDESITAFKALNARIDDIERDVDLVVRTTEEILEQVQKLTENLVPEPPEEEELPENGKPNRFTQYWRDERKKLTGRSDL
jgi:hypothetical protein